MFYVLILRHGGWYCVERCETYRDAMRREGIVLKYDLSAETQIVGEGALSDASRKRYEGHLRERTKA